MARRATLAALAASAFAITTLAAPAGAATLPRAQAAAQAPLVKTTLTTKKPGRRLPPSFVGFSIEYLNLFQFIGNGYSGVNPLLTKLYGDISDTGIGAPRTRVGGGSADSAWWNPDKKPRPQGITYDITPELVSAANGFRQASGTRYTIGLNMAGGQAGYAADWARAASAGLGSGIESFELGNEPDIYFDHWLASAPDGSKIFARPRSYHFGNYLGEFKSFAGQVQAADPGARLAGPSVCCYLRWFDTKGFLRADGRDVSQVTYHLYPLTACVTDTAPKNPPTIQGLLQDGVQNNLALRMLKAAALAHKARKALRITETNSAVCGGAPGVSDTFASSLWSVDWMFTLWAVGVDGADFHASTGASYTPFRFDYDYLRKEWKAEVRPLYYGLLLFARAAAHRARLLPLVTAGTRVRHNAQVKVWATKSGRTAKVIVDNKDGLNSGPVEIKAPGARAPAKLVRLAAPSVDAKTGVTIAGQGFDNPSGDADLKGTYQEETVTPSHGVYRFDLPPFSAAMLSVPGAR